jgi:hypothetical protein
MDVPECFMSRNLRIVLPVQYDAKLISSSNFWRDPPLPPSTPQRSTPVPGFADSQAGY